MITPARLRAAASASGLALLLASVSADGGNGHSSRAPLPSAAGDQTLLLERFLSSAGRQPVPYRALRRLEVTSAERSTGGWLHALTELSPDAGFSYRITAEGGSNWIRARVLKPILAAEERAWRGGQGRKGALTRTNYEFQAGARDAQGLLNFSIIPRRKDVVLVEGTIALTPDGADLVTVQGRLSKNPSFWINRVDIVRRFGRVRGVVVPLIVESSAHVKLAGVYRFVMTYEYEIINGRPTGIAGPATD